MMKKTIKIIRVLFFVFLMSMFISCDSFFSDKHLTERYYLQHNKFGRAICYKVDDSGGCVELVEVDSGMIGFDDRYIIVKNGDYYIIPVYKAMNYFPEKGILGPLSLIDFNLQRQRLNVKANFTINVK